jgi:hypothetical protein
MSLSKELLLSEAERLVARAERKLRRYHSLRDNDRVQQAQQELRRLQLYRAMLQRHSADALMPEYVRARGLVERGAPMQMRFAKAPTSLRREARK